MKPEQTSHPRSVYVRRAAVLTVCLSIIALIAATYWASKLRLPDPATADPEGLVRWLVLRDLRRESPEVRNALLKRIQEEVGRELDPASIRSRVDVRYQDRLWVNILALIETWYSNQVDTYLATPAADRLDCLDRTIAEVKQWKNLAAMQPGQNGDPTAAQSEIVLLRIFTQQVAMWKEKASPLRRKEITEFDAALRGRWMLHTLGLASSQRG